MVNIWLGNCVLSLDVKNRLRMKASGDRSASMQCSIRRAFAQRSARLGSARLGLSLVCRCHHDVSCCRWSHARHCIKLHKIDDWQWHVERCIYNVIDVSVFVSLSVCLSSSLIASHAVARQQERLLYRVRSRHWHSDWDWDYMGLWDCVHGMRYTSIPQWTHKAHYHITVSVCVSVFVFSKLRHRAFTIMSVTKAQL